MCLAHPIEKEERQSHRSKTNNTDYKARQKTSKVIVDDLPTSRRGYFSCQYHLTADK